MQTKNEREVWTKLTAIRLGGKKSSKQSCERENITNLYDAQWVFYDDSFFSFIF